MQSSRPEQEKFEIDVGAIVAGRYRLERLLGRGGMGEVWVAHHSTLDTPYAIKFLDRSLLDDIDRDTILKRFLDEAKASSQLSKQSRHIVSVHDYGEQGGVPYIVMEMLDGMSLDHRVESGPMTPAEALAILDQVCRALTQAHKAKLIHRDLKPGNVFLCRDEEGKLLVKVLDFGLVRSMQPGDKNVTQKGIAVGTPTYMSPEQARASANMDHQCDVWSMAVLSYAMLAGKTPWPGETMQEVLVNVCRSEYIPMSVAKPELGTMFDPFYEKAFQRQVKDRFRDAEDLVRAFRSAASTEADLAASGVAPVAIREVTTTANQLSASGIPGVAESRGRGRMAAGAALLVLLVGFGFFFVSRGGPDRADAAPHPPAPTQQSTQARIPDPVPTTDKTTVSPTELPKAPPTAAKLPNGPGPKTPAQPTGVPPVVTQPAAATPPPPTPTPAATPSATHKPHDKSEVL